MSTTTETAATGQQPPLTERLRTAASSSTADAAVDLPNYTVLRAIEKAYELVGSHDARSAEHAIRLAVERRHANGDDPSGVYVAIPARSWKPVEIKTEKRTVLDIKGL